MNDKKHIIYKTARPKFIQDHWACRTDHLAVQIAVPGPDICTVHPFDSGLGYLSKMAYHFLELLQTDSSQLLDSCVPMDLVSLGSPYTSNILKNDIYCVRVPLTYRKSTVSVLLSDFINLEFFQFCSFKWLHNKTNIIFKGLEEPTN